MSEHKSGVVVGGKRGKAGGGSQRLILVVSVVSVVVLVLGAGVAVYVAFFQKEADDSSGRERATAYDPKAVTNSQRLSSEASVLEHRGDYAGAQALLREEAQQAADDKAKGEALEAAARVALNAGKYEEALEFARQADDLNSTASSLQLIATIAEFMGNEELAIEQYKALIAQADRDRDTFTVKGYEEQIVRLGGTP